MPTLKHGADRTGLIEVIWNWKAVDPAAFPAKENLSNVSRHEEFEEGEWATLDGNGEVNKIVADVPKAWPCRTGHERTDVFGSGTVTLLIGSGYHLQTDKFDLSGYVAGDYVYGVDLSTVDGKLAPAQSTEHIHAMVIQGPFDFQLKAERALGQDPTSVIIIEVGYRGIAA